MRSDYLDWMQAQQEWIDELEYKAQLEEEQDTQQEEPETEDEEV